MITEQAFSERQLYYVGNLNEQIPERFLGSACEQEESLLVNGMPEEGSLLQENGKTECLC